jgi:drug/metabolite transporter (DMT)-like permease
MTKNIKAHLAILGANLIYGGNYSIAKLVMPQYILPMGFIFLRVISGVFLFWLTQKIAIKEKIKKEDVGLLAICGLFGVAINQLLFFKGLNLTSPINAGIIMTSNPIMVLLIASFILKERLSKNKIFGVLLGIVGACILILFNGKLQISEDTIWGDLMVLGNSLSYGVYLVLVKPLMTKYHPITVLKWVFTFGLVFVIPFGVEEFAQIDWVLMPNHILWAVFYVVIFTTFLTYLLNNYALKNVSPAVVSAYIYTQPILATMIAIMMKQDSLDFIKIISSALIFVGVYLVSIPSATRKI